VDQSLLKGIRVVTHDQYGENQDLLSEIELIASQLGAPPPKKHTEGDKEWDFMAVLGDSEIPNLPEERKGYFCRVLLLDDGVLITTKPDPNAGKPSSLQKRGLCTIASSLFWQEVLRRTGAILPIEVPKRYVDLSLRFNPRSLPSPFNPEDVALVDKEGLELDGVEMIRREDGSGHWVAKVRLEEGKQLADSILGSLRLENRAPEDSFEPSEVELRLPRLDGQVRGTALVAGAGGLGSWAIHAFCGGMAESGSDGDGLRVFILDPDMSVERHNLNRQVMYSEEDIGHPKATTVADKIRQALPGATVVPFIDKLGLVHLQVMGEPDESQYQSEPLQVEEIDFLGEFATNLSVAETLDDFLDDIFATSGVALACVDNLRARSLLGAIAAKSGIPMINAGAQGFNGQLDVFLPGESCMICRHGKNAVRSEVRMSCQEDGEIPFSTIVTSTAIFGALQGLAMMAAISEEGNISSWPSQVNWSGRPNSFSIVEDPAFGPFSFAFSSQGDHSHHLEANLVETAGGNDAR
jgi:molybdopterin/thiamine biosynthesis adenylyltransferase